MKIKQIITCAFFASLMLGFVHASQLPKKEEIIEIEEEQPKKKPPVQEKKQKSSKYLIHFYKTDFPVSKEVVKQFGAYKAQVSFEQKKEAQEDVQKKIGEPIVWDITTFIKTIMPKNPTAADWNFFEQYIKQLLLIESNKLDPYEIDKERLFKIIQIADLLWNEKVMQKCTPALIGKLTGKPYQVDPIQTFKGVVGWIYMLPDGSGLVAKVKDGQYKLWTFGKKDPVQTFKGVSYDVKLLPDGSGLVAKAKDGQYKLWKFGKEEPVQTFKGVDSSINLLPDGSGFVAMATDKKCKLWELGKEEPVQTFKGVNSYINLLPDGRGFVAKATDGKYKLWKFGKEIPGQVFADKPPTRDIYMLPNSRGFVAVAKDKKYKMWWFGIELPMTLPNEFVGYIDILPDGSGFVGQTTDKKYKLWKFFARRTYQVFNEVFSWIYMLPDSSGFVAKATDGKWKLWRANLTFEQIKFIYNIFTSKKKIKVLLDSLDYNTLKSLPNFLQKVIEESGRVQVYEEL